MKNILKISLFIVLVLLVAPEVFGAIRPGNSVGVPLDGGLLAILAGAGLAYYTARSKKKKNKE